MRSRRRYYYGVAVPHPQTGIWRWAAAALRPTQMTHSKDALSPGGFSEWLIYSPYRPKGSLAFGGMVERKPLTMRPHVLRKALAGRLCGSHTQAEARSPDSFGLTAVRSQAPVCA